MSRNILNSLKWFCFLYLCLAAGNSAAEESAETAQQLRVITERLNVLDQWFNEAEEKRSIWVSDIQQQDREIARVNTDVTAVVASLEEVAVSLAELTEQKRTLQSQQHQQAEHIANHVTAAYRLTGQDFLKQLLNQESPDTLDRMMRYHRYFSESRLEVLADYRETLTQLEETNLALAEQQKKQTLERTSLEKQQSTLNRERNKRAELVAALDLESETKTQEYERLVKDRERLETLLAELRRRGTELDGSAFAAARGNLPMPADGRVRHAFGSARADNRLRWHGIDIAADHGSDVSAVFRGRVIFSDWLRGFGFLTIVDHGSDYMSLYGHVDALYKKVGDLVESGEPIAAAGNSGGTSQSGVYFEIRHKGEPIDPIGWVNR